MKIIRRKIKTHKPIYFATLEQFASAVYVENKHGVIWFKVLFENLSRNNNFYYKTYILFKLDKIPDKPLKPKDVEYTYYKHITMRGKPQKRILNVRIVE